MSQTTREIYIRFASAKFGKGMFEAPASTLEEAAGQFCEDVDSTNAYELMLDEAGVLVSSRDVTAEVLKVIKDLIDDDQFTHSPHPLVDDHFTRWEAESEAEARSDADHIRSESMTSIFL